MKTFRNLCIVVTLLSFCLVASTRCDASTRSDAEAEIVLGITYDEICLFDNVFANPQALVLYEFAQSLLDQAITDYYRSDFNDATTLAAEAVSIYKQVVQMLGHL